MQVTSSNISAACIADYLPFFHSHTRFYAILYSAQMNVSYFISLVVFHMDCPDFYVILTGQRVAESTSQSDYTTNCRIYRSAPIIGQGYIHCIRVGMLPKTRDARYRRIARQGPA